MGIGFPTAAGEGTAVGSISMNGTSVIPSFLPGNPPKELIAEHRPQPDQNNGNDSATANEILRPVLDFMLMAIILIPVQWYTGSRLDESDIEMVWARVAQGVWISWLTHAAGLLDEALRVFLGIRLTQGLGTPTSVNKVYSKMSRWAEVVAEGIAVDDFPALATLYAGGLDQGITKLSSSGEVGAAAAEAKANRSLVMRVEHVSATAYLWSFLPWKTVRRYQRVNVKGMTLRLRQVNGILNFSFLALRAKRGHPGGLGGFRHDRLGPGDDGIDELDGLTDYQECRRRSLADASMGNYSQEGGERHHEPSALKSVEVEQEQEVRKKQTGNTHLETEKGRQEDEADEVFTQHDEVVTQHDDAESLRGIFDTMSEGGATRGRGLRKGQRGRRFPSPWTAPRTSGTKQWDRQNQSKDGPGQNAQSNGIPSAQPGTTPRCSRSALVENLSSEGPQLQSQAATPHRIDGSREGALEDQETSDPCEKGSQPSGNGNKAEKPTENLGNLGVVKVLGEAFMRRYNAYAEQVSATFNRVANIKLLPDFWRPRGSGKRGVSKGEPKRYEVEEILLEDVCICVDSGVWNDLLGDHVGAAFSPQFCLEVKVGPQELLTPDGRGRPAREIGMLLNEKLVRLLARLVMRETLKTSTLTNMVITSLALDTDARGRQQIKHKSLSPPPLARCLRSSSHGNLISNKRSTVSGGSGSDTKALDRRGKLWRGGSRFGVPRGGELQRTGSGRDRGSSPPLVPVERVPPGRTGEGGNHPRLWRRRHLRKWGSDSSAGGGDGGGIASSGVPDTDWSESRIAPRKRAMAMGDRRGRQTLQTKRSLPNLRRPRRSWQRESDPDVLMSMSPTPRHSRRWLSGDVGDPRDVEDLGNIDAVAGSGMCATSSKSNPDGNGIGAGAEVNCDQNDGKELETVARPPPWMEEVSAPATYEEIKPALDVIKRTVLLAVLQQSNGNAFADGTAYSSTPRQNGALWGSAREVSESRREEMREFNKVLERRMQEELSAWRDAGGDVDRLVMKALLAKVHESGPNTAFKALASVEISSLIESLAAETRFATYFENGGIDVARVARSFGGRTVGEMLEGVRITAGRVGQHAQRLRAEAVRWRKELLDDNGILPILSSDAGQGSTSLASAVESLSDTISVASGVGASGAATAFPAPSGSGVGGCLSGDGADAADAADATDAPDAPDPDNGDSKQGSWEKGSAISADASVRHQVEGRLGTGTRGDREAVDEVDVIMQVLQLLEAIESLKEGIVTGDSAALGKVEQAVGRVAQGVDVYLILAAGESMLGFLLERLGKLPVGHAKFVGKGFEYRVWNLDLEGVRIARDKVDLVMKGFRLPKRGSAVMTPFGPGRIKRYKKRSRCFVVNLDWTLGNGKPAKAYLQPSDIVVLQGHEGELSDDEEEGEHRSDVKNTANDECHQHEEDEAGSVQSKCSGAGEGIGADNEKENAHVSLQDSNDDPPAHKGKRSKGSLYWIWGRRRGANSAEGRPTSKRSRGGMGSENDVSAGKSGRWGRRGSTPPSVLPPPPPVTKIWQREKSTNSLVESEDGVDITGSQKKPDEDPHKSPESLPRVLPAEWTVCPLKPEEGRGEKEGEDLGREDARDGNGASLDGPESADFLAAPFLVARISGVGAKLKDIKWSVKQTHFPHFKTAGNLEATVSGLAIELELDTQDLPVTSPPNKDPRRRGTTDAAKQRAARSKLGATPKGLRLSRLKVSVRTVKVHVSHSALSSVYNFAAVTFEAAVKRYIVESVEVAVRKSMFALLAMVNSQVSEKWDLLRSVGGGAMAGANGPGCSAVDKVLAASFSHQVVWAPRPQHSSPESPIVVSPSVANGSTDGINHGGDDGDGGGDGGDGSGDDTGDSADGEGSGAKYHTGSRSFPEDRLGSSSSKTSTESELPDVYMEGIVQRGGGEDDTRSSCGTEPITKRSLRRRLMGAVSRPIQPAGQRVMRLPAPSPTRLPAAATQPTPQSMVPSGANRGHTRVDRIFQDFTPVERVEVENRDEERVSSYRQDVPPTHLGSSLRRRSLQGRKEGLSLNEIAEGLDSGVDLGRVQSNSVGLRAIWSRRAVVDGPLEARTTIN